MKNTIICMSYILAVFASWAFFTIFWTILLPDMSYYQVLVHPAQVNGFFLIYWWCPAVFVAIDVTEKFK